MMRSLSLVGVLLSLMASQGAWGAEGDVRTPEVRPELWMKFNEVKNDKALREQYLTQVSIRATFCFSCHGKDGNSTRPHIPKLAGQNASYILEQVEKFSDGRRNHYVMVPLAKEFSDEDKVGFALFFSQNQLIPAEADADLAKRGQAIYEQKCVHCHGADGRGSKGYARLAGQQPLYVENTLINFRSHDDRRHNELMEQVASTLSKEEIKAVANYVATLR